MGIPTRAARRTVARRRTTTRATPKPSASITDTRARGIEVMRPAPEILVPAPVRQGLSSILPAWLTGWWQHTFASVTPRERWGYRVWGAVGVVITVPELWAAKTGDALWFPTI